MFKWLNQNVSTLFTYSLFRFLFGLVFFPGIRHSFIVTRFFEEKDILPLSSLRFFEEKDILPFSFDFCNSCARRIQIQYEIN